MRAFLLLAFTAAWQHPALPTHSRTSFANCCVFDFRNPSTIRHQRLQPLNVSLHCPHSLVLLSTDSIRRELCCHVISCNIIRCQRHLVTLSEPTPSRGRLGQYTGYIGTVLNVCVSRASEVTNVHRNCACADVCMRAGGLAHVGLRRENSNYNGS